LEEPAFFAFSAAFSAFFAFFACVSAFFAFLASSAFFSFFFCAALLAFVRAISLFLFLIEKKNQFYLKSRYSHGDARNGRYFESRSTSRPITRSHHQLRS
tara:strand:- start:1252 stop:1551 length:300 start_codon:yes stop_codon:yes gene_type:complete